MNIECPKCNKSFNIEARVILPEEQVLYLKLTAQCELFTAKAVGQAILNMEKLQRAIAKDIGADLIVFIQSLELKPNEIVIGFRMINSTRK